MEKSITALWGIHLQHFQKWNSDGSSNIIQLRIQWNSSQNWDNLFHHGGKHTNTTQNRHGKVPIFTTKTAGHRRRTVARHRGVGPLPPWR